MEARVAALVAGMRPAISQVEILISFNLKSHILSI